MAARFLNAENLSKEKCYHWSVDFDPLQSLTDLELYKEYRFDKEGILFLTDLLKDDFPKKLSQRGLPIKPHIVVMSGLLYLASNTYQIHIACRLGVV